MYRVVCDTPQYENIVDGPYNEMWRVYRAAKALISTENATNVDIQKLTDDGWVLVSAHVELEPTK